jgi:copper chaperone
VKSYNVSLDTQTADVTTDEKVAYETVLEKIKKTGKTDLQRSTRNLVVD